MDGTGRTVLIDTNLATPYAITIDYDTQTLYWADYDLDKIESASTNGTNRTLVTTASVTSPNGITFYDGILYWSDTNYPDSIYSINVSSPDVVTTVRSYIDDPYSIHVITEDRQPERKFVSVCLCPC